MNHSNSCQILLQKGNLDCSKLEKVADAFLLFPRFMWLGRSIKVKIEKEEAEIIDEEGKSLLNLFPLDIHDEIDIISLLSLSVFFAAGSILATPLLGLGIFCKKFSLNNSKAKHYHKIIKIASEEVKLARKKEKLNEEQSYIKREIEIIDKLVKGLIIPTISKNKKESMMNERDFFESKSIKIVRQLHDIETQWTAVHEKVKQAIIDYKILVVEI